MPFIPDPLSPWETIYANSLGQKTAMPLSEAQPIEDENTGELRPGGMAARGTCDTCGIKINTKDFVESTQGRNYQKVRPGFILNPDTKLWTRIESPKIKHDTLTPDVPTACESCARKHTMLY